jgi:hypothetical protein
MMLMYLSHDKRLYSAKYQDYSLISARLNKRGLLTQRKGYAARETIYDNYIDLMQMDEDKGGKVGTNGMAIKGLVIYETPSDVRGSGQVKLVYLNSPVAKWRMSDAWTYSPGLRRVVRSQGGDRQDEILGTPVTGDDEGDRNVWEEEHSLIGEDVLYMQMLDPQMIAPDRQFNTGDLTKDGEWLAKNLDPTRGQERMSPYRPDGGIECWVVMSQWAKRTDKYGSHMFPDPMQYYLKYRISWIEKVTKIPIREEQYDHDNRLIKHGFSLNPEFYGGGFVNGGSNRTQYTMYDYRRHFRSWGSYDRADTGPKAKAPDDFYTPDHLFREYFWKKVKVPMMKSSKEFAPSPEIYRTKFPKYRKGTSDWLFNSKEDMDYMAKTWKDQGFTDEEINAMMNGDGVIRKDGKVTPVRKNFRPAFIHGKPLPVKFPTS